MNEDYRPQSGVRERSMTRSVWTVLAAGFLWTAWDVSVHTIQTAPAQPAPTQPAPTQPAPTQPAPAQTAPAQKRQAAPRTTSVRISVRDEAGNPIPDVHLVVSGAAPGELATGAAGTAIVPDLKPGSYRVRAEHDGYITLEREFTLGRGVWNPIELVLNAAPAPPPPPPPPPTAPPPVAPPPAASSGPPVAVSIPDFLDRNFIGREPIKESVLACTPLQTLRLLQLREALAEHVHEGLDEIIYVVAGEGVVRIGDEVTNLRPGVVMMLPNGSRHAFERRGKNPLVLVSTFAGAACEAAS
jgi:hypothetical protein